MQTSLRYDVGLAVLRLRCWFSLAKLGRHAEAVAIHRCALAPDPDNAGLLNDLGWALTENSQYQEAERVLQQAVDLAPPAYDLPRNNLEEARRLKGSVKPT